MRLRFIERDGQRILQYTEPEFNGTWEDVPCETLPAPKPQKWEVSVELGTWWIDGALVPWAESRPFATDHRPEARITLEFGPGWARVKPTVRDRELASMLRQFKTSSYPGWDQWKVWAEEAADRLDGGDK